MFLLYNDINGFRLVNCQGDTDLIQFDPSTLYDWCTNHTFILNINKCQLMTFSKARVVSKYDYYDIYALW